MPKKDLYIRAYKIMFAEYPDVVNVKEVNAWYWKRQGL